MRHRKIPSKNRKKLKLVDPFNTKAGKVFSAAARKKNFEPKNSDLSEQPLSKSQSNLKEAMEMKLHDKTVVKARKKHANTVLREAENLGMKKGRFETIDAFIRRVDRTMNACIDEHKVKEMAGTAGRDKTELRADFKIIEDKEKRAKDQKKREIQNKIVAARKEREDRAKRFKDAAKRKEERRKQYAMANEESDEEQEEDDESMDEDQQSKSDDDEDTEKVDVKKSKPKTEEESTEKPIGKAHGNKKERREQKAKVKKQSERDGIADEAVLNSREVLSFGERYDEPPKFDGILKRKFNPLMSKAGSKNLLLHSLIKKSSDVKTTYIEEERKSKIDEEDRLRVIEAYRNLKRSRRVLE